MQKKVIVFVCKGNIHRSIVAEICLKQELKRLGLEREYEVISRGIQGCCGTAMSKHANLTQYETEWSITKPILEGMSVDLSKIAEHNAQPIAEEDMQRANIVFAMELAVMGEADVPLNNSLQIQFPMLYSKFIFLENLKKIVKICLTAEGQEIKIFMYW